MGVMHVHDLNAGTTEQSRFLSDPTKQSNK